MWFSGRTVRDYAFVWGGLSFGVAALFAFFSYQFQTEWLGSLLMGVASVFLSASLALVIVNVFLEQRARKKASGPLFLLIKTPINRYHNDIFLQAGWDKFGKEEFGRHIATFETNGRNCDGWSADVRQRMLELVESQGAEIIETIEQIDARLTDLVNVLGWNFDPHIIGTAIQAKLKIAEFYSVTPPKDEKERLDRVIAFFEIEAAANASLQRLYKTLTGENLTE